MNLADIFAAGATRLQMTDSIEMTIQSLLAYGASHEHWGIAWSGGKDIQAEVNAAARAAGRPLVDLINAEEEARILQLIDLQTWPDGWDGDEPIATTIMDTVYVNGVVQPRQFSEEDL